MTDLMDLKTVASRLGYTLSSDRCLYKYIELTQYPYKDIFALEYELDSFLEHVSRIAFLDPVERIEYSITPKIFLEHTFRLSSTRIACHRRWWTRNPLPSGVYVQGNFYDNDPSDRSSHSQS